MSRETPIDYHIVTSKINELLTKGPVYHIECSRKYQGYGKECPGQGS